MLPTSTLVFTPTTAYENYIPVSGADRFVSDRDSVL